MGYILDSEEMTNRIILKTSNLPCEMTESSLGFHSAVHELNYEGPQARWLPVWLYTSHSHGVGLSVFTSQTLLWQKPSRSKGQSEVGLSSLLESLWQITDSHLPKSVPPFPHL